MRKYYRPFFIGISLAFVSACGTLDNGSERPNTSYPLINNKFASQINYEEEKRRLGYSGAKQMINKKREGQ